MTEKDPVSIGIVENDTLNALPIEKAETVVAKDASDALPIEKPNGMSVEAASTYDSMSQDPKPKIPPMTPRTKSVQARIHTIENKLNAKMNKILKRRKKNARAKKSRKKNRK